MVITLTGENTYAARAELNRLVAGFSKQHGELGISRFDGESLELDRLKDAVLGGSLFAPAGMAVVSGSATNKALHEPLLEIIRQVPDDSLLVLYEPGIDRRTVFFKTLQKITDLKDFKHLADHGLAAWVADFTKKTGGTIDRAAVSELVARAGSDQWRLSQEIIKLVSYRPEVTVETVALLVDPNPTETIFNLLDAVVNGRQQQALGLYRGLREQQEEPQKILSMVAWQLHALALVKHAGSRSPAEIAREGKISPYVAGKLQGPAKRLSKTRLQELLQAAVKVDADMKSINIDPDQAVEQLIINLSA